MSIIEIRMTEDQNEGTEASLGKWLKTPGNRVAEHEPLVEINTDKVTIEIAAPASGTLRELLKTSGETVLPGDLLGTIDTDGTASSSDSIHKTPASNPSPASQPPALSQPDNAATFSPVVRRMLSELNLDPQSISKVSRGGRLTPADIAAHVSAKPPATAEAETDPRFAGHRFPHTPMRKSIANHMARSVQTAPHVTSVFEADLSNVLADREARKQAAPAEPAPSITAYLIRAALAAIKLVPEVNSKWHDAYLEVFDHVNFGVGTALDSGGLVVPIIRNAHMMDILEISQRLREMTQKARAGKLTQADMEGGTFTLSNHGVSGSLLAAPIILPHGQAAILGAGKMQKRAIVCETNGRELFRIRPMMYVTLTVDHRVLDGRQTNGFLTAFVAKLENP